MRNDLISLKMVINKMKLPNDINTFENRLKLQKALYLIQISGIDLGYRYSWYLRGPYSTALAKDLYELDADVKEYKDVSKEYNFADDIKPLISGCSQLLMKPSDIELKDEEWYELLASLHYLKHIAYLPDCTNPEERNFDIIYKNLPVGKRSRFEQATAIKGWEFLGRFKLIEKKELDPLSTHQAKNVIL